MSHDDYDDDVNLRMMLNTLGDYYLYKSGIITTEELKARKDFIHRCNHPEWHWLRLECINAIEDGHDRFDLSANYRYAKLVKQIDKLKFNTFNDWASVNKVSVNRDDENNVFEILFDGNDGFN
jgi:hypothetical protein